MASGVPRSNTLAASAARITASFRGGIGFSRSVVSVEERLEDLARPALRGVIFAHAGLAVKYSSPLLARMPHRLLRFGLSRKHPEPRMFARHDALKPAL